MLTDRDLAIEVLARGGDASRQTVGNLVRGPVGLLTGWRSGSGRLGCARRLR